MNELQALRSELKELNREFFTLFEKRKNLVQQIQKLKNKTLNYDEVQEKALFLALKDDLVKLSPYEILAFSLLMEDHARVEADSYPYFYSKNFERDLNPNLKAFL